jgi:hypothetical protein
MVNFAAQGKRVQNCMADQAGRTLWLPSLNENCAHSVNYHPTADKCPWA